MANKQDTKDSNLSKEVVTAQKKLEAALIRQYEQQGAIERSDDDKFVIPKRLSFREAAKQLDTLADQEETETETTIRLNCHPNDGLVNFYLAMKERFGSLMADSQTFQFLFWKFVDPAHTMSVPISFGETMNVPVGNVVVPGLPIEISVSVKENKEQPIDGWVYIVLKYQRKWEPLVTDIERMVKLRLRDNSIFKGKAINSNYEFLDLTKADVTKIVYTRHVRRALEANIFLPIHNPQAVEAMGVPLKRNILLYGPYGTGKTLTALKAAHECSIGAKWTFMLVRPGDSIVSALNFARKFQPALVFFEDIDTATSGDRTEELNAVLNTIDGMLGKSDKIITILTTNHAERISRAMLRPGRIDEVISLGEVDAESIVELVKVHVGNKIEGTLDGNVLVDIAAGYPQAFIVEAARKALLLAHVDGRKAVTPDDVVDALRNQKHQYTLMMGTQVIEQPALDKVFNGLVATQAAEAVRVGLEEFKEQLNPRILREED